MLPAIRVSLRPHLGSHGERRSIAGPRRVEVLVDRLVGVASMGEREVAHDGVAEHRSADRQRALRQIHDLAGDTRESTVQGPVDDDPGSETVVEEQQREAAESCAGAFGEFGESREIDVVLDPHRTSEPCGQPVLERTAVGTLIVADASVGGDDAGDADDSEQQRPVHRAPTRVDEPGDVLHPVAARRECGVGLGSHCPGRVDQRDMGRVGVDVHGRGEPELRMQCDAPRCGSARVTVDPGRGHR